MQALFVDWAKPIKTNKIDHLSKMAVYLNRWDSLFTGFFMVRKQPENVHKICFWHSYLLGVLLFNQNIFPIVIG